MLLTQLEQVQADIVARRPVAVLTMLSTGAHTVVHPGDRLSDDLSSTVLEAVRKDKSQVVQTAAGEIFINVLGNTLK